MTVTRYNGTCPVCYHHQRLRTMNMGTWPRAMKDAKLHLEADAKFGMVHHGYRRPGVGFIMGDCYGVGWPPWELSPNGNIGYVANALQPELASAALYLSQLEAGIITKFHVKPRRSAWGQQPETIVLTPADGDKFTRQHQVETVNTENRIRWLAQDIEERQKLIAEWQEQPLETEEEERQKRQRMTDERRAAIDAAREAKRQKRAHLDAKARARVDEKLALLAEYRSIFNTLAFEAEKEPWVHKEAVEQWKTMQKRKSKKAYLDFYESELGIDAALVALKLAAPSRHRQGKYDYANDLGWEPQ